MAASLPTFFGESGQFVEITPLKTAPDVAFIDDAGRQHRLSDFSGRALLVNIWATWCAPCVREMPALERLQEDLGGTDFAVLPISIDGGGAPVVRRFYQSTGIDDLPLLLDPRQRSVFTREDEPRPDAFPLYALPISYFVDRRGRLRGYLVGAADWDSKEARSFIEHLSAGGDGRTTAAIR